MSKIVKIKFYLVFIKDFKWELVFQEQTNMEKNYKMMVGASGPLQLEVTRGN